MERPSPNPGRALSPAVTRAEESLRKPSAVFGRDARSLIHDLDAVLRALFAEGDADRGTVRTVLQGIVDEVAQGLLEQHGIRDRGGGGCHPLEALPAGFGEDGEFRGTVAHQLIETDGLAVVDATAALRASQFQQPVYEGLDPMLLLEHAADEVPILGGRAFA